VYSAITLEVQAMWQSMDCSCSIQHALWLGPMMQQQQHNSNLQS
jgi:hypothetical protein